MRDQPTIISVGMPVFNGELWLRGAVEAILAQTHSKFELIISDNASTDATQNLAEQLATTDERIKYHRRNQNAGATENYNSVLHLASGEYFKWASCNDYCAPEFLQRCLEVLQADPSIVLAYPKTCLFEDALEKALPYDDNLHLVDEDPYDRFVKFSQRVRLNNVMNGVIRRNALLKTALMRPYYAADTCLMAELALHGKFYEIPERLFYRRMDAKSATKLKSEQEVLRHWRPDMRPVQFSVSRAVIQKFAALMRAPLDFGQRLRLSAYLCRQTVWARKSIWNEIVESGRYYFGFWQHRNNA